MARQKKLSIKLFENKILSKNTDGYDVIFHPLYLNVIFNKKVTTLKSPSFDFTENTSLFTHWITEQPNIIEMNDTRLINNIREYYEKSGREFSVLELKKTNKAFSKLSSTLFDAFRYEIVSELITYFYSKKEFQYTSIMAASSFNYIYFLRSLKELNTEIYKDIIYTIPKKAQIIEVLAGLLEKNIIPYVVDYLNDEEFTNQLKELGFDTYVKNLNSVF